MNRIAAAILVGLLLADAASAASKTLELTVAAGKQDRAQTPVCVPLTLPAEFAAATAVVKDAAGQTLPAQVTGPSLRTAKDAKPAADSVFRELHFVLPRLKAGATATYLVTLNNAAVTPPTASSPDRFTWHDPTDDLTELRWGGKPVLQYVHPTFDDSTPQRREQTYKVFHHLFDPTGSRLVTKGPGGLYTHHRGLFYGFNKVTYDGKNVDIWHCTRDTYQGHDKVLATEAGPVLGRHRVEIAWHGAGKEVFAREERELTVYQVPGGRLVEFASRLRSAGPTIKLDGDPQHAGFHFRADNEVNEKSKKQTYYLRPDGKGKPGETRNWPQDKAHVNLPWDAMSFVLGGQRYTVAYLDHRANPKEARFSERDYGRFGSYFEAAVTPEKPLLVRYRVWLQEGELTGDNAAALAADFVDPVAAAVK